jgi:hypothetical protein
MHKDDGQVCSHHVFGRPSGLGGGRIDGQPASSEQSPIAFSIRSPWEAISYLSQHSSDFTRRVHYASKVRIQVSREERILSA